jgi:hypothetical protein
MKRTADALREVGHTISPAQLVLNLLRGLNSRFANTADIITNSSPLPDFKSATNMLRVKELRLGTAGNEASASALAASTTSSCTSPSCRTTPSASTNRGGDGKGKGGKGKVGAAAMAAVAVAAAGATSSKVAGVRLLSRLALGSATTLGPLSGHLSSSSSRVRHPRFLHRHTPPSRRLSSPLLAVLRRMRLQAAGIRPA